MTRREILKWTMLSGLGLFLPGLAAVPAAASIPVPRPTGKISVESLNYREELEIAYLNRDGTVDAKAMDAIDQLFRCHHTGQVHPIAPALIMTLDALRQALGVNKNAYTLVCGYRSPRYIMEERRQGGKPAVNSFHAKGMAADIRLDGVSLREVAEAARALRLGGVGVYSDFVHVDIGTVRCWRG